MCSLRFENNFLTVGHVRFRLENSCLGIESVRFASKIICVLSNVFASFRKEYAYYRRCSLRFDIEENTTIEAFVRFRFASVAITSQILKVWWQLPLFLFIFSFTDTYIHTYISSLVSLSRKNLPGVPSRDLNLGLPYSRPARYQLSYAAPYTN